MDSDDDRDPLDRFMQGRDVSIVPDQLPSVRHGEKLQLSFSGPDTAITVDLILDASPGCGGVAWPAGEVGGLIIYGKFSLLCGPGPCSISRETWPKFSPGQESCRTWVGCGFPPSHKFCSLNLATTRRGSLDSLQRCLEGLSI